jgi:hypothetical protein
MPYSVTLLCAWTAVGAHTALAAIASPERLTAFLFFIEFSPALCLRNSLDKAIPAAANSRRAALLA